MITTIQKFCDDLMLTQIVNTLTHYQGNVPDRIFTNNESLIDNCITAPTIMSASHHHIVRADTQYKAPIQPQEENTHPKLQGFS